MTSVAPRNPVFVSIDTPDTAQAAEWARRLEPWVGGIKLGLEFFTAQGPQGLAQVAGAARVPLFIDLKLHDIPNTVAGAMRGVTRLAPAIATIHSAGGRDMIRAAVDAAGSEAHKLGIARPKVIAVTILTSLDQTALDDIGFGRSVESQVLRLAELAVSAGADGVVCSPHEVAALRRALGSDAHLVVPGIRPAGGALGDQKRVTTPSQALSAGADVLVIGRPITEAADPVAAAQAIAEELKSRELGS